jgi:hypothetical protein
VPRDHRRVLLLAAEAAAGLHLYDAHFLGRQREQAGERLVDVVGALHRAPHGHAVRGIGDGEHAVRLDVELLLRAGLVVPFDDDDVAGERRVDVALLHHVALEQVVGAPHDLAPRERVVDREHGRQRLDVEDDVPPRLVGARAIAMRDERDRLLAVVDDVTREERLIVEDQLDDVRPGDVGGGDDDELVPRDRGIERDRLDPPARDRAPYGDPVQHARRRHVVHVHRLPGDLGAPFLAQHRSADLGDVHPAILVQHLLRGRDVAAMLAGRCRRIQEHGSRFTVTAGRISSEATRRRLGATALRVRPSTRRTRQLAAAVGAASGRACVRA